VACGDSGAAAHGCSVSGEADSPALTANGVAEAWLLPVGGVGAATCKNGCAGRGAGVAVAEVADVLSLPPGGVGGAGLGVAPLPKMMSGTSTPSSCRGACSVAASSLDGPAVGVVNTAYI
jgi:hypothetical protein